MADNPATVVEFNRAICERLRNLRKARGASQSEIAATMGLEPDSYPKYENRNPPPYYLLARFALLYRVSLDYLVTGKESPFAVGRSRRMSRRTVS